MKNKLFILLLLAVLPCIRTIAHEGNDYHCGDRVLVTATPKPGCHFVEWSDGVTDNPREIDIEQDTNLVAIFQPDCREFAQVPVVRLYDWVLLLDMDSLRKLGYIVPEQAVSWYRIVDGIDERVSATDINDDALVGNGYYLTLGQDLKNTGDYYAVIDVSQNDSVAQCKDWMQTEVVHYAPDVPVAAVSLRPTLVVRGQELQVLGTGYEGTAQLTTYDPTGKMIRQEQRQAQPILYMKAEMVAGCYLVEVKTSAGTTLLKYIVKD